ncbi:MAG: hypothetical protein PHU08_00535 [Dehalococcoidales bacterium]|nr:hypothetical protein [Dehalococcoidales bacterium]
MSRDTKLIKSIEQRRRVLLNQIQQLQREFDYLKRSGDIDSKVSIPRK